MERAQVSPHGVTLNYLVELCNTIETNILAKGTELLTVRSNVITAEGDTLTPGTTLELVKRGGLFAWPKVRLPGSDAVFEVPRTKLEFKRRSHWTVDDVTEFVVKPAVDDRFIALANTLDRRHLTTRKYDCYYLSAPGSSSFAKLIAALKEYFDGEDDDPHNIFIWFEPIHVDPYALQSDKDKEFVRDYELSIADRVEACAEHLVFVETWGFRGALRSPTIASFEDAKVLWEIAAARDKDIDTFVILPPEANRDLLASFRTHGLTFFEQVLESISIADSPGLKYLAEILGASAKADHDDGSSESEDDDDDDDDDADDNKEDTDLEQSQEEDNDPSTALGAAKYMQRAALTNRVIIRQLEIWFMHLFAKEVPKLAQKKDIEFEPAAKAINRIAVMHSRNGEWDEAIELFDYVIRFTRLGEGTSHPSLAYALNNKALLLQRKRELKLAVPLLEEAIEILESHDGYERECAMIVNNLVTIYESLEDFEAAEVMLRRLVQLRAAAFGAKSVPVALALNHIGGVQIKLGDIATAKTSLLEALSILEKAREVREDDPNLAAVIDDLATVYDVETNHTAGDGSGHHSSVAATLLQLARVYKKEQEEARHEEMARRGLELLTDVLGADHPETQKYSRDLLE